MSKIKHISKELTGFTKEFKDKFDYKGLFCNDLKITKPHTTEQDVDKFLKENGYKNIYNKPYESLKRWLAKFTNGEINKGLFLFGDVGTGKTKFAKLASSFIGKFKYIESIDILYHYNHNNRKWRILGLKKSTSYFSKNWVLDDFGIEPLFSNFGGGFISTCENFIRNRYYEFEKYKVITIITSNQSLDLLRDKLYIDDRTYDRIKAMCYEIQIKGESLR